MLTLNVRSTRTARRLTRDEVIAAVSAARTGDNDALSLLIDTHSESIMGEVYRYTSLRNISHLFRDSDLYDLAVQVVRIAVRKFDWVAHPGVQFATFAGRVVRTVVREFLRANDMKAVPLGDHGDLIADGHDPVVDLLCGDEARSAVFGTVASWRSGTAAERKDARYLTLRFIDGLEFHEIGELDGTSRQAAHQNTTRAVKRLKASLQESRPGLFS